MAQVNSQAFLEDFTKEIGKLIGTVHNEEQQQQQHSSCQMTSTDSADPSSHILT